MNNNKKVFAICIKIIKNIVQKGKNHKNYIKILTLRNFGFIIKSQ